MKFPFFSKRNAILYMPENPNLLICTVMDAAQADEVWEICDADRASFAILCVTDADWDHDLSPWPAKRAFKGGNDFSGNAEIFLKILTDDLLPAAKEKTGHLPTAIAGYSLAGLFSLWSLTKTNAFSAASCMSGSLWFDGFLEYMESHPYIGKPFFLYFSLGDRERFTKHPRFYTCWENMMRIKAMAENSGIASVYVEHKGNHFADVPVRIAAGLKALALQNNGAMEN